jgi:hypothetical protein
LWLNPQAEGEDCRVGRDRGIDVMLVEPELLTENFQHSNCFSQVHGKLIYDMLMWSHHHAVKRTLVRSWRDQGANLTFSHSPYEVHLCHLYKDTIIPPSQCGSKD